MKSIWIGCLMVLLLAGCGSSSEGPILDTGGPDQDSVSADTDTTIATGLVSVELRVEPEADLYEIGDTVSFSWVALDADNNEITDVAGATQADLLRLAVGQTELAA